MFRIDSAIQKSDLFSGTVTSRRTCLLFMAGVVASGKGFVLANDPAVTAKGRAAATAAAASEKENRFMPEYFVDRLKVLPKTEAEWGKILTAEQFKILRKKGTERAFTGALWDNKRPGVYGCAGCGEPLFGSYAKFESGTGWPSFWRPLAPHVVATRADNTFFMRRVEVICARCKGHLGHVFQDGPPPTGLRYCMNSAALRFEDERSEEQELTK